jgi:predicted DNA-binding protein (MmcQ/YjbR family)
MDGDEALAYALNLPGAWADNPFHEDRQLAKVGPKIFFFPGLLDDRPTMSVKNTAEGVSELKQRLPDHAGIAPYLNKRLWVRVLLDGLADDEARELIEDSYDLVVSTLPRALRPS